MFITIHLINKNITPHDLKNKIMWCFSIYFDKDTKSLSKISQKEKKMITI